MKHILIVGGGTAGWLAANVIAARHSRADQSGVRVSVLESSDIPTIGVGEGTWPTMRNTVRDIGIDEKELFRTCFAAFKQGGKFVDWVHGNGDFYYHPFTVPLGYGRVDLAPYIEHIEEFAISSNFQHHLCEAGLAPRGLNDPDFQGPCNYAYHLDAGAFTELLKTHGKNNLGIEHHIGTVDDVRLDSQGNIDGIKTQDGQTLAADLYVDCTGFSALLIGKTMEVPFTSMKSTLFNDRAIAVQLPYDSEADPIASHTIATGHKAGWTWDIGLTSRRGVGYVYASDYMDDSEAEEVLANYCGREHDNIPRKKIRFDTGHRELFWKNNCVAIGLSAGFVDPLEATALMLVEISARYISDNLPAEASVTALVAKRFNQQMHYRWQRIIDFLKLHYMLSKRPEPYWRDHRDPASIPQSLMDDLDIWRYRGPVTADFDSAIELFPAASYQYVMYGMGFRPQFEKQQYLYQQRRQADQIISRNATLTQQLLGSLPPHREYIQSWLATKG